MPRMKFQPTDDLRQKVKALAGCGVSQQQICLLIGIRSRKTLRKHFRNELKLGVVEAVANVQRAALRLAASGRNPRMTRRWLERWLRRSPGMQLGREPEETSYQWIVQEYQPPVPDDDPRRSLVSAFETRTLEPWDGDDPAGRDNDDGA